MAATQDILLTYKTDTGEVTKSLDEIVSGLEGVDNKIEETAQSTKKVEAGLKATGKAGSIGFNAIGGAIKATGIGLLVGIVAKLIEKFTENKKVAEALEVVFAGIGAVINTLFEVVEPLGDALINAFNNPMETLKNFGKIIKENIINRFEGILEFLPAIGKAISLVFKGEFAEAGKVAADAAGKMVLGVENVTDKIVAAGEAIGEFATDFVDSTKTAISSSNDLVKAQQRLRDQQRDLNVEYAQARAEIEQLKQKRDDERLSIEERVEAAQRASELDQEFADKREAIANREVALVQREIEQQGETVERLDRLAEARIAAAEAAESSAAVQTELMTSIYGLEQEAILIGEEKIAKELEAAETRNRLAQEESDRKDAEAAKDKARDQEIQDAKFQIASQGLAALSALSSAFASKDEKNAERQFKIQKALSLASATVSSTEAVINAYKTAQGSPFTLLNPAYPAIQAILAGAFGAAQIATIARSSFQSPGAPNPGAGGGGRGGGTAPTPTSPQLDLSFLGGGAGQDGFRTYVIASEVSNSQQANQKINDQAALVG
jgi:hypothetical protein